MRLPRRADHLQPVTQPLHHRPRNKDRAFQRVNRLALQPIGHRRQQTVLRRHHLRPGVQQRKTPRPIGRFHHPRLKTRLPHRRRLLIPRHTRNWHRSPEHSRIRHPEIIGAIAHLGQHPQRYVQQPANLGIPFLRADIEQHRPRCIRRIRRVNPPPRQPPDQERVHRPERQPPRLRQGARPRGRIQQILDLRPRKIRVQQQAGLGRNHRLQPALFQPGAHRRRPPVLPDNRVVNRLAGRLVPDQHRLALIGDPDTGQIARPETSFGHRLPHRCQHRLPQVRRIMLDPARARINLRKLRLCAGHHPQTAVKHNRPR